MVQAGGLLSVTVHLLVSKNRIPPSICEDLMGYSLSDGQYPTQQVERGSEGATERERFLKAGQGSQIEKRIISGEVTFTWDKRVLLGGGWTGHM